ncbi:maleylpyruvate isomerase N-terminal domain-containing protein [Kineococcus arenarius]|uniref:maleylpyruvate isomerase N-terminal domain-containing protein n=1 Tax=unclassified Kineococcus TaxID=2621656 RepID=UPI003D7D5120
MPETTTASSANLRATLHPERAALTQRLASLTPAQWALPSLCGRWSVEDVLAHLSTVTATERTRWPRSMVAARLDPDVHNDRRLAEQRGPTPTAATGLGLPCRRP